MPTFRHTLARPAVSALGDDPFTVHLAWSLGDPEAVELTVQVYVDDELYAVVADAAWRETWLELDRTIAHRIELLAVDPADALTPRPRRLTGWRPAVEDVARLTLLRDEALPVDTPVALAVDGQAHGVTPMWPADEHRAGFGSLFGAGGFGIDAATGLGLGRGELGLGSLGADGTALRFAVPGLPAGDHTLTASASGNDPLTRTRTIAPLPPPVMNLRIDDDWTLRWDEPLST